MYKFELHRPTTLVEARNLFETSASATYLAGGQTLIPTLKHRLARPSDLIDLSCIEALRRLDIENESVRIGALERHAAVAESKEISQAIPALAGLAGGIADQMVRNLGTIGGSVANNDPAADYPAAVLGLNAIVHTDRRDIRADAFFVAMFETALESGEIITGFTFPRPELAAYVKLAHPVTGYALVGVFIARFADGVRVAVTGAAPSVFRAADLEGMLAHDFNSVTVDSWQPDVETMNNDLHASGEYRAHLLKVAIRRAIEAATCRRAP